MIVIIDYNVGNVKSVLNAFKRIGIDAIVSRKEEDIKNAKGIVLPGVGSFPVAMENLEKFNLINILNDAKQKGIPILGICLGMQILFENGVEVRKTKGLSYLKGDVKLIKTSEKLPHMGWNELIFNKNDDILKYISENDDVYFVHSYMADFIDSQVVCYTEYGGTKIPAIVRNKNVIGCQFHPEKSGEIGEKILRAWKESLEC